MARRTHEVKIPTFVRSTSGPGDDVIACQPGTTATAWAATDPAVPLRNGACESAVFLIIRIKGRSRDVSAEHFGAHQVEDSAVRETLPRESLAGFPSLFPLFEEITLEDEDEGLLSSRRQRLSDLLFDLPITELFTFLDPFGIGLRFGRLDRLPGFGPGYVAFPERFLHFGERVEAIGYIQERACLLVFETQTLARIVGGRCMPVFQIQPALLDVLEIKAKHRLHASVGAG
jgi:hypothetical protein